MKSRVITKKLSKLHIAVIAIIAGALGSYVVFFSSAATACDLNATASNFSTQVSAASTGQTICLASGNYGTWTGTNKAITITAAVNAAPAMKINFGSTATSFTIDGIKGLGGTVTSTKNVTIKNSDFSSSIDFEGNNVNFVLDGNTLDWDARSGGINSKIFFDVANKGTLADPAVTIKNNHIANGDLDGVHTGGKGLLILNNVFDNLCDLGQNHTDNIQFEGGSETRIAGNYIHENANCPTQGITSFDGGTNGVIIENNVVDIHRPWAIELYADTNSIVRHNTLVWYSDANCDFNNLECGEVDITHKDADPAGSGTQIYDNIATDVGFSNGSTGTADHNVSGQTAVFAVGVNPTNHDGFLLATNSPVGKNAASDGTDVGIYTLGSTGTPTPKTGDLNADSQVNIFDLSILLSNYGKTKAQASNPACDLNNDSTINIFDLSILLSNYGK